MDNKTDAEELEIDLDRIFRAVARRWLALLLTALMTAGGFFACARYLIPPKYESGVMIYVCKDSGEQLSSENLSIARKLVESCMVILTTRQTQRAILDHAGMTLTCEDLDEMVTAEAMGETEFFRVTVTGKDPVEAERIADAVAAVMPGQVSALIEGFSVKVADAAVLPVEAAGPGSLHRAAMGFALGLILGVTAVVIAELKKGRP